MIHEAFDMRNWKLKAIEWECAETVVMANETATTFACVSEW